MSGPSERARLRARTDLDRLVPLLRPMIGMECAGGQGRPGISRVRVIGLSVSEPPGSIRSISVRSRWNSWSDAVFAIATGALPSIPKEFGDHAGNVARALAYLGEDPAFDCGLIDERVACVRVASEDAPRQFILDLTNEAADLGDLGPLLDAARGLAAALPDGAYAPLAVGADVLPALSAHERLALEMRQATFSPVLRERCADLVRAAPRDGGVSIRVRRARDLAIVARAEGLDGLELHLLGAVRLAA